METGAPGPMIDCETPESLKSFGSGSCPHLWQRYWCLRNGAASEYVSEMTK